jgi:hypothetical protein
MARFSFLSQALPVWFVEEHGFKIDKWVILRTRTTYGTSSRPWVVQLKAYEKLNGTRDVQFVDGWKAFATHYQLKEGDSLIFLLSKEGARSEFEVYVFEGTGGGSFSFLDLSDGSGEEEGEDEESAFESKKKTNLPVSLRPSRAHHQAKATTGNGSEGKASTLKLTEHVEIPSFRKRLCASSIKKGGYAGHFVSFMTSNYNPNPKHRITTRFAYAGLQHNSSSSGTVFSCARA